MIAYLEKYDTTVEVPDDIGQKDLQDINENFHSYVDKKPQTTQPTTPATGQPEGTQPQGTQAPEPTQKWQSNFYESAIKPSLDQILLPLKEVGKITESPEAQAFAGKTLDELTFGATKPLIDPILSAPYALHPAFAAAGQMTGGVGSLLEVGGALRIAGLGAEAASAGKTAVEAGFAAGERFIPRAIMSGATFGTRTFIAETVKAFHDGGVDLEKFGKDVLKDTAFGAIFGTIGGLENVKASVSSAGALGFLSSKMSGADNREASLNAAIWAAFETVGSFGRKPELRLEALGHLKESMAEYAAERNPGLGQENARKVASTFVDNAIRKEGYANAEEIAKSGPENLLEGIEKVNQMVRTAQIPQESPEEVLPKLPAAPAPETPEATTQKQIDQAMGMAKEILGMPKEPEPTPPTPEEATAAQKSEIGKNLSTISDRLERLGVKPEESDALYNAYAKDWTGLMNSPIDDQYRMAYQTLADERGIDKGDKFDSRTMEDARNAVDLINGHFNPRSQMVFDFAKQHQELSDHDVAQMAYNRGLLEEPNNDLLKLEIQKAKEEKIVTAMSVAPEGRAEEPNSSGAVSQPQTGQQPTSPNQAGGIEELRRSVFPGPSVDSYRSITGKPDYIKMREQATDIVSKYATDRGIKPTQEFAQSVWQELHDALGSIMRAPASERAAVAESVKAKYPDIQREFMVLKDQLYSDKTGQIYFDKNVVGRYVDKPIINAMMAPGAAVLPKTPEAVLPAVAAHLDASKNEITNLVAPTNAAPLAAQITREQLGKMARSYDMAEAALSEARAYFDKQPKEANLDFIDKVERGQDLGDRNVLGIKGGQVQTLNGIARQLRKLLDDKRKEIQALGTGKMQSFIENYFPHIWDQGEDEVGQVVQKAAKRPFEGSKSFLKKRKIEFTKDGIEIGLTPVSYNPVDLALLKIREMDKYLMAHRTIKEYKQNGLAKYIKIGGDVPDGWQKIDDRISTIFKSPMIAVKEAYDEKMMNDLNAVAKGLGIDLERKVSIRKHQGIPAGAWGYSESTTPGEPGKITSKFAGPESVIAHELGHQIDNIYGLQKKFLADEDVRRELTDLADERGSTSSSQKFKNYIQSPEEKMAVMFEAYIHAPELMKETAPITYGLLNQFLHSKPELKPLTEVKPSLRLGVSESEVSAGGAVIAGHIYAQPDAARIINNYLSPGLQKSPVYQVFRYAGNLINQFQLGFSAFHLGFTSLDSSVSKFALALNELFAGNPIAAIKKTLQVPIAPIENIIRGNDLLKAWRGEGKSASDEVLAQVMASAGGRARMDQFYATRAYDQLKHHFEAGNVVRGILHIPLSIAELSSKPILEWIVPRQKLGVFADMMKMELENHPDMTHDQMRQIAQRAWDSVDNRMGQLVYDNLFWNRTFKDVLMASVRSVGWNLGTLRELPGGAKDYAEAIANAAKGKKTEFSYRMAYFAALPIVVGTLGAMIQYLRTGKGPQEAKDYFFPKTGGVDANGHPTRIALPSYMKDVYHWSQNPAKVAMDKLHPIFSILGNMYQNKDYYGVKIRNEDDPLVKQVTSEAAFILKQITPFSIRNMQKNLETGNKTLFDTVGPWVGITPAPYDINQTKAEKLAHEIAASHQEIGGRTEEQANRSRLTNELTRQYRRGDPNATANLYQAYQEGKISHRQMQDVIVHSTMTPLQKMVKGFTLQEAERVYRASNDEEKAQIDRILQRKIVNQQRAFVHAPGE